MPCGYNAPLQEPHLSLNSILAKETSSKTGCLYASDTQTHTDSSRSNQTKPSVRPFFRPWQDHDLPEESNAKNSSTMTDSVSDLSPANAPALDVSAASHTRKLHCLQQVAGEKGDETKSALEALATSMGKTSSGYRCIYCGKLYSRKYGLKIHLRTHTGFKPLKCKVCQRAFGDPSNLNKHTRLHMEQGAVFKCKQCGKLLLRKKELERHLADCCKDVVMEWDCGTAKDETTEIDVVGL